jgi:hypothetical protein
MFKGNATLDISHATMVEALQEYLNKRVNERYPLIVKSIKATSSGSSGYNQTVTFAVEVEEKVLAPPLPS